MVLYLDEEDRMQLSAQQLEQFDREGYLFFLRPTNQGRTTIFRISKKRGPSLFLRVS